MEELAAKDVPGGTVKPAPAHPMARGSWAGGAGATVKAAPAGVGSSKKKGKKGKGFRFTPAGDGFRT